MEKEFRTIGNIEIRKSENINSRTVEGYALCFESDSRNIGFTERIAKGALDGVIEQEDTDIRATYNHNPDPIYARYRTKCENNSLTLEVDDKGLRFSFDCPNNAYGDYILEGVRRNDFTDCSFAFTVAEDGEHWEKDNEGNYKRTILKFDHIYDVAICPIGAYGEPQVACRSFEKFKEELRAKEDEEKDNKDDNDTKDKGNDNDNKETPTDTPKGSEGSNDTHKTDEKQSGDSINDDKKDENEERKMQELNEYYAELRKFIV